MLSFLLKFINFPNLFILSGDVVSKIDLPDVGNCVIIDMIKSAIKSTIKAHDGNDVNTIDISPQTNMLISGGSDGRIVGWKINQTTLTLTQLWNCKCEHWVLSLYVYLNHVFANVGYNNTIAVDIINGNIIKKYSKTEWSKGIVVIGGDGLLNIRGIVRAFLKIRHRFICINLHFS